MNFLKAIAKPFTSIFHFLASPKGKAIIATGEAVVEAIDPALTPVINLANSWMDKVLATEQLAVTAATQPGSGPDKAALVMTAMAPEIAKYFPAATAAEIQKANDAIVAFLQAFSVPNTPATGSTTPVSVPAGATVASSVAGPGLGQK